MKDLDKYSGIWRVWARRRDEGHLSAADVWGVIETPVWLSYNNFNMKKETQHQKQLREKVSEN